MRSKWQGVSTCASGCHPDRGTACCDTILFSDSDDTQKRGGNNKMEMLLAVMVAAASFPPPPFIPPRSLHKEGVRAVIEGCVVRGSRLHNLRSEH